MSGRKQEQIKKTQTKCNLDGQILHGDMGKTDAVEAIVISECI